MEYTEDQYKEAVLKAKKQCDWNRENELDYRPTPEGILAMEKAGKKLAENFRQNSPPLVAFNKTNSVFIAETAVYNQKYLLWAENSKNWWSAYYSSVENNTPFNLPYPDLPPDLPGRPCRQLPLLSMTTSIAIDSRESFISINQFANGYFLGVFGIFLLGVAIQNVFSIKIDWDSAVFDSYIEFTI